MASGEATASRAVPFAVVATLVAGVLTYVLLGIVSRGLDTPGFDAFSVFWSVSLLVGFGVFVPFEQELARAAASGADVRSDLRSLVPLAAMLALAASAASLAIGVMAVGADSAPLLVAFALIGPVSAVQFVARGLMLGRGRIRRYATVLIVDSVLRVLFALLVGAVVQGSSMDVAWFAFGLLGAIALAHLGVLADARGGSRAEVVARRASWSAVIGLLGAGLASQVLLNAGPIAVDVVGAPEGATGAFQATFNIARIPIFVLVPLQALLLAPFVRVFAVGQAALARRVLAWIGGAFALVSVVGGVVALFIGPWLVELVFGPGRQLDSLSTAILVAGACLYAGLVILTQALVSVRRHRIASRIWVGALAVAALSALGIELVSRDIVWAVGCGFAMGSAVGFIVAVVDLSRPTAREKESS